MVGYPDGERALFGYEVGGYTCRTRHNERQRFVGYFEQIPRYGGHIPVVAGYIVYLVRQNYHALFVLGTFQRIYCGDGFSVRCVAAYSPDRVGGVQYRTAPAEDFYGAVYLFLHLVLHIIEVFSPAKLGHFFVFFVKRLYFCDLEKRCSIIRDIDKMGRAFEYRKAAKLKRWGHMARTFTRIGKAIEMSVKAAGPDPANNTRLRLLIQNAKAENMPKDNIERAIKRAISKDAADYKEMVYEGYGPHGIAIMVETATDNPTRTVANVRSYFNKLGGTLGTSGSVGFMFEHKAIFKTPMKEGINLEELELELIDFEVDEVFVDDENFINISGPFESFGQIQAYLEEHGMEITSGEFIRLPTDTKELPEDQRQSVEKLIEKLEEDDDVVNVFHNMKEE